MWKFCLSGTQACLLRRRRRAIVRADGLKHFSELLRKVETSDVRRQLVRCFASSFQKRSPVSNRITKDHFLVNLEGCGLALKERLSNSYFSVLEMVSQHILTSGSDATEKLLVLDACTMSFTKDDFIKYGYNHQQLLDLSDTIAFSNEIILSSLNSFSFIFFCDPCTFLV
jgi:hypothetical protein